MVRTEWGLWQFSATYTDPKFAKRLYWIARCAGITTGMLHILDYLKGNQGHYFFEVYSVYAPFEYPWGWGTKPKDLIPHHCYYLGRYPNYWNMDNQRIVLANDLMTANAFPMGIEPTIPAARDRTISAEEYLKWASEGTPYEEWIPDAYKNDREQMEFFLGKKWSDTYWNQKAALDLKRKFQKACVAKNYPDDHWAREPEPEEKPAPAPAPPGPTPPPPPPPGPGPGEEGYGLTLTISSDVGTLIQQLSGSITIGKKRK